MLGATADWIEGVRRDWYPRLHPYLKPLGGYATGHTGWDQFVGIFYEDEDTIEVELEALGLVRNPIAAYKELPDGRQSEGSWVLRVEHDEYNLVAQGMQLHITLFQTDDGRPGRVLYAHYEDDWRVRPRAHLRGHRLSAKMGVKKARTLIDDHSYLRRHGQFENGPLKN